MQRTKIVGISRRAFRGVCNLAGNPNAVPAVEPLEVRRHLAADVPVRVMTQNLAYGAGTGADLFAGAMTGDLWQNVEASDFPARAAAIARQAEQEQPDLIGLQEAVIWRTGRPFRSSAARDVQLDFAQIMVDALGERGMWYRAVATATNADLEFPGRVGSDFRDIRMTDQDVILARVKRGARATVIGTDSGNYDATFNLSVPILGDMPFTRGWAVVDARMGTDGRPFRFVTTHLDAFNSTVRQQQAEELLAGPASSLKVPVLIGGDFNAAPGSEAYETLRGGGFYDAWNWVHGDRSGPTCCQDDDLANDDSRLTSRIDAILFRGKRMGAVAADRVGEDPADKTPSGLWPSDHAGVTSTITFDRRR